MFKIMGKYRQMPWEEVDEAEDKDEADYLLKEYKLAYGEGWKLKIVKE